jgi:hypothetical protein
MFRIIRRAYNPLIQSSIRTSPDSARKLKLELALPESPNPEDHPQITPISPICESK